MRPGVASRPLTPPFRSAAIRNTGTPTHDLYRSTQLGRRPKRSLAVVLVTTAVLALTLSAEYLIDRADPSNPFGHGSALAAFQDATPSASSVTIDPAECRVEPRPLAGFESVIGTPGAVSAILMGTPIATGEIPSGGTPADPAVVDAVTATAREFLACANAGDMRRAAALLTDDAFRQFYGGIDQRDVAELAGIPTPLPMELRASSVAVEDVRVLEDGRVTAVTEINGGRNVLIFVATGDRYLLDASAELPAAGTPTP